MKKRIFGRKLGRTTNERKALFRNLAQSLILQGYIKTTEAKAKAIKGDIEKTVTYAIKKVDQAPRHLKRELSVDAVNFLISTVAPANKDRQGGYTRTIRLGNRIKDNAPMVLMEWVEGNIKDQILKNNNESKKKKKDKSSSKELNVKQLKSGEEKAREKNLQQKELKK